MTFDLIFLVPLGLALLVGLMAGARAVRRRRRSRRRVVEGPNSQYTPQLVREGETRNRWRAIDLDRIHEINREEVVRLLERVEAAGMDSLRPTERDFLDYMAKLAQRSPSPERRGTAGGSGLGPELRHRPA